LLRQCLQGTKATVFLRSQEEVRQLGETSKKYRDSLRKAGLVSIVREENIDFENDQSTRII